MTRTRFVVLIGTIVLAALVVVVTLVAIDANNRYEACEAKHGIRAPLFCD